MLYLTFLLGFHYLVFHYLVFGRGHDVNVFKLDSSAYQETRAVISNSVLFLLFGTKVIPLYVMILYPC